MASIFFSISSGKLEIVKVLHKTRTRDKLEAIKLFRAETILRIPNHTSTIGEEITRCIHYGRSTTTKLKITISVEYCLPASLLISYVETIFSH